jgi:hypothetical protein
MDADTLERPEAAEAEPSKAEQIRTAAAEIVDGIYFGLPMEVYLEVPRLGASDLQALNVSPADFWAGSWLDPERTSAADEDEDQERRKKHLLIGEAYHCARLEPDAFAERFCRQPCKADYADQAKELGACWNGKEIEAQLAALQLPKKQATDSGVADQARRLRDAGFEGVIWPLIEADFRFENEGLKALDARIWDEIMRDMERLRGSEAVASKLKGEPEVSVFWTDRNGIQRKARFDNLDVDKWSDLKTFDNPRGKRLENAIRDAVQYNRYYLTAGAYLEASEAIRNGRVQIIGEATERQREIIAKIQIRPDIQDCWFIFQQKRGVPNLLARRFIFFDVPPTIEHSWDSGASEEAKARGHDATRRPTQIYQKAMNEIDYAKKMFVMYSEVYRPGVPWAPIEPEGSIDDSDFSPSFLEGRYD